jgi:DNA-binding MarR family transcriptional regulator
MMKDQTVAAAVNSSVNPNNSAEPGQPIVQTDTAARLTEDKLKGLATYIFVYRHLLRNLDSQPTRADLTPHGAAVLARLWADRDLNLEPKAQNIIARELGMDTGDLGKLLKKLRKPGKHGRGPRVMRVGDTEARHKTYTITDAGRDELLEWILNHDAPGPFMNFIVSVAPAEQLVSDFLKKLQQEVKNELTGNERR